MGRSKVEEKDEATPEGYIHVYTQLIERMKSEQVTTEPGFWYDEGCEVIKGYQRELEKWKNHISQK